MQVDLPLATLGVLGDHPHEHLGPVLGFKTALARDDGDDRVTVIKLSREPRGQLDVIDAPEQVTLGRGSLSG